MTTNERVIHHCIAALGDYGKPEDVDLLLNYLTTSKQNIKIAVVEAFGKIGDERMIEPLKNIYSTDMSYLDRLAIVDSICCLKNKTKAKDALAVILSNETNQNIKDYIKRTIQGLN